MLEIDPEHVYAHYNLGMIEVRSHDSGIFVVKRPGPYAPRYATS